MPAAPEAVTVSFSHVHMYCDSLRPLDEYRKLEAKLNSFADVAKTSGLTGPYGTVTDVAAGREKWLGLAKEHSDVAVGLQDPSQYKPVRQDVVEQLLVGLGWRVTGSHEGSDTQSLVASTEDPNGVRFVVTAHRQLSIEQLAQQTEGPASKRPRSEGCLEHFAGHRLTEFARYHKGRQGISVLGFVVAKGDCARIHAKYADLHPKLLVENGHQTYGDAAVLEVYAYYTGEIRETDADPGTLLRFVEAGQDVYVVPGVEKLNATFDGVSQASYCDHWVSNVFSRTGFLQTLNDTLGFTPKVDFNAGVVAAGEAQIESTVTGNSTDLLLSSKAAALKDQSQVYLPINNALSEVGHVNVFLKELGQGIQHIASRVEDLGMLIQRANDYRKVTGAGLSFLSIPPSYYGYLTGKRLEKEAGLSPAAAEECLAALREAGILDVKNIVSLDTTPEAVSAALPKDLPNRSDLVAHVLRARYFNLYMLLREHVTEETYLRMVRNNILVDIQGEDLLLQIFTSKVLQRGDSDEAPFLEFIQRVCSECKDAKGCPKPIKPGCGGFGIRNFLTLFLSIEVSKAAAARAEAEKRGDARSMDLEGRRVDAFTAQLDESNPVLTGISDAMTAEGEALERGDLEAARGHGAEKAKGSEALQAISSKYKDVMRKLREEELASAN